jgi:hypothetical protein
MRYRPTPISPTACSTTFAPRHSMPIFTAIAVAVTGLAAGTFIDEAEIVEIDERSEENEGEDE